MIEIPRRLYNEIIEHAQEGWPNEVCGMIAGKDRPEKIYRVTNVAPDKPTFYIMDPQEQYNILMEIEENDLGLYGVYHSHPASQAYPSKRDLEHAWPDTIYFICSLQDRQRPQLRGFLIVDGEIREQGIRVVEGEPQADQAITCC